MTAAVLDLPRRISPAKALQDGFTLAWRGVLKIRKNPEQLADVTIQPILFLLMFGYLFGGAIAGNTSAYIEVLVPALMVQNTVFASLATGTSLNTDVTKGVFDRFRAMPIAGPRRWSVRWCRTSCGTRWRSRCCWSPAWPWGTACTPTSVRCWSASR